MTVVIRVENLRKRYGAVEAVSGIDLVVYGGEIFGLLGPNGAGKTTTVEMIAGLRSADSGTVRVFGLDPVVQRRTLMRRMALQPQSMDFLDNVRVQEIVALFAELYGRHGHLDELLALVGLAERKRAYFHQLSGGQKQRLNIALTLLGNPELVILDEPTAALDPQARVQIQDLIRRLKGEGRTVLLTTHYIEEAQRLSDRVAVIDHGRIIALGTPRELIARSQGRTCIEFQTTLPEEDLHGLEGVERMIRENDTIFCWSTDPTKTLADLFQKGQGDRHSIGQVLIHPPTLEDVFIELTGRRFRD
jgi:ABC-2 type transport system ATP-binding protein